MHAAALAYIAAHLPAAPRSVLEFGSRNINGSVRTVTTPKRYVGVDVVDGDGVDIVEDAAHVWVDGLFDAVVCAEVFEHIPDDVCAAMCVNAYRHLVDGGRFVVTMAGPGREPHSAVDGGMVRPEEFYRNVTRTQLCEWLLDAGFGIVNVDERDDDLRGWAVK